MNRRVTYVGLSLVLLFAIAAVYEYVKPATIHGETIDPPKLMADFTLQSTKGPVKLSDFRGKYLALYFGYTSCPDICPTTLATLSAAMKKLDAKTASQVQVVFVSVDYKRDTPERVNNYAQKFYPDFMGLGGTKAQIDQATKEFGVFYQLGTPDPVTGDYLVQHTAVVMVLNPQGEWEASWPYGQQADDIVSDLQAFVNKR